MPQPQPQWKDTEAFVPPPSLLFPVKRAPRSLPADKCLPPDTPLTDTQVQNLGKREAVGHALAHKKSGRGGGGGAGGGGAARQPSPAMALLAQQRRSTALSPAARALATKLRGGATPLGRPGTGGAGGSARDEGLRASYRSHAAGTRGGGVGSRPGSSRPTSRMATPLAAAAARSGSGAYCGGAAAEAAAGTTTTAPAAGGSLTDDLLKL